MSPVLYTRRTTDHDDENDDDTTVVVASSPMKHLRSKPPRSTFRDSSEGMEDDDTMGDGLTRGWYELQDDDDDDDEPEETSPGVRTTTTGRHHRGRFHHHYRPTVPNNTPATATTWRRTTHRPCNHPGNCRSSSSTMIPTTKTATRLLFQTNDDDDDPDLPTPATSRTLVRRPAFSTLPSSTEPTPSRPSTGGSSTSTISSISSTVPLKSQNHANLLLDNNCSSSAAMSISSTSPPSPSSSSSSHLSPPGGRRKRNSNERNEAASTPPRRDAAPSAYRSPQPPPNHHHHPHHLSPNSYRTMDGRFVQSKNPFSSPMMMTMNAAGRTEPYDDSTTAPSLPAFPPVHERTAATTTLRDADPTTTGTDSPTSNVLQPKRTAAAILVPHGTPVSQATVELQAFSFTARTDRTDETMLPEESSLFLVPSSSSLLPSYRRNSYVCSPILESPVHPPAVNSTRMDATTAPPILTMDGELPTAGSLQKVRRIHQSDDVFRASRHHFVSHFRPTAPPPQIDTTSTKYEQHEEDDISPTDVTTTLFSKATRPPGTTQNFFAPTPAVPKHGPPPTPMKPPRSSNPDVLLFSTHPKVAATTTHTTPHPHLPRRTTTTTKWPVSPRRQRPQHVLQPRTPLVATLSSDSHHATRLPSYYDVTKSGHSNIDDDDEVWMFESDNRCGYTDLTTTHAAPESPPVPTSRFTTDFDIIGELGHGSFGHVYKVLSRLDGCMYAVKAAKRQAKGTADRDRMLKEVYALAALSDQADTANFHIVRYHQAWMEDDRLYIQTELCSGTLSDEMNRVPPVLNVPRRYKLLREILLALDFIHRHNMVHLDIKPENIFIKNDQYKLGDFGLVTKASSSQDVEEGDSRYMSMELLSGDNRSDLTKSDIFSLGITMYEICLGRQLPMNGEEWQDIRAGKLSPLPNTDHDMANIIRRMLDPNPVNRPTPASLLKHPQLLSDEEKALNAERTKVIQANIQLAAQQQMHFGGQPVPKRPLTRANTWSGSSLPYL